jgi:hypothetical protein
MNQTPTSKEANIKMTTIDLGNGQTAQRHRLPKSMLRDFDDTSALGQVQAGIRAWVKSLLAMQAPANFSGDIICTAVTQSGRTYTVPELGGAVLVDQRDVATFVNIGFTTVPSGTAPTTGLRPGLLFLDTSLNEYMRWDGTSWAPVTLE